MGQGGIAVPKLKDGVPYRLVRKAAKDKTAREDDATKAAARRRDSHRCRWPRCEYRRVSQPIDPAHVFQAKGMGGDPTLVRSERKHYLLLCRMHHDAQEKHDLEVKALTPDLADGACAFFETPRNVRILVGRETSPGVLQR